VCVVKCAPNTSSPTASTSAKACLCKPGFTGPDCGLCVACEIGTYKQNAEAFACSNCSANTMTRERGSDEYADCLCECCLEFVSFNTVTNISICAACPQGKYKEETGHPQVCVSRGATASSTSAPASTVLPTPSKCQWAMLLAHFVLQILLRLQDQKHGQCANACQGLQDPAAGCVHRAHRASIRV
jgi:hypothetical protein